MRKAPVSDAEFRVLEALWAQPGLTARQLTDLLYPQAGTAEIGTVQKLLQRLEAKRQVKRNRGQHVHRFSAVSTRAAYTGEQLERMADKLASGSLAPVIMHLVQAKKLRKDEIDELRAFLNDF